MKTVVIDGIFFQINEWSGIAKLWRKLLHDIDAVLAGAEDIRVFLLARGDSKNLRNHDFQSIHVLPVAYFDETCGLSDFEELGLLCRSLDATVFISSYYSLAYGTANVGMAYDFITESLDWMHKPGWQIKRLYMQSLSRCFSISHSTARQASLYYPNLISELEDIFYPPMGNEEFQIPESRLISAFRSKYGLFYPYVAIVGHRADYKNADLLTMALQNRPGNAKPIAMGIVATSGEEISPGEASLYAQHFQFGIKRLRLEADEMGLFLHAAESLFYPTLLEGFGYPVAEALAQRCPVITTGATSIKEILAHADDGDYQIISGHDPQEALRAIIRSLHTGQRASHTTATRLQAAFSEPQAVRFLERLLAVADRTPPPRTPPELEACLSLDGILA